MRISEEAPGLVARSALLGWVGRVVAHRPRRDTAPFQLGCEGEGVVLLDAAVQASSESAMANLRREFTNLPNLVTMGRVVLVPFVLIFIDNFSPLRSFIASLLYLGAAAGDALDGYLARSRGQVSMLGKFLDPLADKLIVTAVLVFMVALGRVPAWVVVVLHRARPRDQRPAQRRLGAGAGRSPPATAARSRPRCSWWRS